jgi:hypothetical protein
LAQRALDHLEVLSHREAALETVKQVARAFALS